MTAKCAIVRHDGALPQKWPFAPIFEAGGGILGQVMREQKGE